MSARMPVNERVLAGDPTQQLKLAIANGDDGTCFERLSALASSSGGGGGCLRLPTTFATLAAAGLARSAVKLAQLESGEADLREAEADDGSSYMHAAAAAGAPAAVLAALAAAGCSLNALDERGDTPLHVAAAARHLGTVKALLEAGADALLRNNRTGRTARAQGGLSNEVKVALLEAEEAARRQRAVQQAALWDDKMRATQTASACRLGCL